MKIPKTNYAFVDGSFNPDTKVYGYGGFIIDQNGVKHIRQGNGSNPDMTKLRNVAGEILGACQILEYAYNILKMDRITLFYDYDGVANWPTKKWKTNNHNTAKYANRINVLFECGFKIIFKHVKSHTGIPENEEVDRLAKAAVGIIKKGSD